MKDLKKLAVILRALGITANVVSDTITCNGEVVSNNTFCEYLNDAINDLNKWRHSGVDFSYYILDTDNNKVLDY